MIEFAAGILLGFLIAQVVRRRIRRRIRLRWTKADEIEWERIDQQMRAAR